jgi:hypothetical protein
MKATIIHVLISYWFLHNWNPRQNEDTEKIMTPGNWKHPEFIQIEIFQQSLQIIPIGFCSGGNPYGCQPAYI